MLIFMVKKTFYDKISLSCGCSVSYSFGVYVFVLSACMSAAGIFLSYLCAMNMCAVRQSVVNVGHFLLP